MSDLKAGAAAAIRSRRDGLIELSHRIHAHPEVAFEEEKACGWLCEALADAGFTVERAAGGLPTAFVARAGAGPFHVGFCAEYDALPGIGHACGHNVIAALAVGAAIGAAAIADDAGLTVSVVGTPAEETGGGKIRLLDRGVFAGLDAAMMVHPTPIDAVTPRLVAAAHFQVDYYGKDAHAAMAPELGVNALDALTLAQTAVALLRQHLRPDEQVHGIVAKGGDMPNVIPSHTVARYMIRAETADRLDALERKVGRCFEAGALAAGCRVEFAFDPPYAHVIHDMAMAELYRRNAIALGRRFPEAPATSPAGGPSTDMGNVSHRIPSIHPFIGIDSLPAVNHQPEFAAHCISEAADRAIEDGGAALAWTAIDAARQALNPK